MAKNISQEEIRRVFAQVKHPLIDCSLVDLGIIKDVAVENDKVVIAMAFPFPNIPIGDDLVNSVKESIKKLGVEIEVKLGVMNHEEVEKFLAMEKENWKGNA